MRKSYQKGALAWERLPEKGVLPSLPDETMTEEWNLFKADVVEYLEKRHFIEHKEPRSLWHEGCPMGNGDMGVLAYGPPEAAMFLFGKTDLWDWRPFGKANYPSAGFPALRKAAAEKDDRRFQELKEKSRRPLQVDAPTAKPGGMLRLELYPCSKIMSFYQRLSFASAETVQTWGVAGDRKPSMCKFSLTPDPVVMTSFVHAARNVFAINIQTGKYPFHEPIAVSLWRHEDPDMEPPEAHVAEGRAWIRQNLPGGQHFIMLFGCDCESFEYFDVGGRILAKGKPKADTVTFYVSLVTSLDAENPLRQARENILDACRTGFTALHETHRKWWHGYWRRAYVATPWPEVERKWYQALYLHACIQRPGRMSPGLQGNFIKENYPAWNGDFHNNINIQIINWSYLTANRLELGEPFYSLYHKILPRVEKDTQEYFGMRGARYPISMGPDGVETCPGQFLSAWIGSSGWLALHYWWHYLYSGDLEFLRRYAYPVIRAAALFYEDHLQEKADGRLYAHPTVLMELMAAYVDGFGTNSIWDWPVIIRTFQMAGEAAQALGLDAHDRQRWDEILAKMAPLPATGNGIWKEFADKPLLHMHQWEWTKYMAVFPMGLVGEDSGPAELREQARKTLEDHFAYWKEHGDTPDAAYRALAGFGMAGPTLARMGMGERALGFAQWVCGNPGLVSNESTGQNSSWFCPSGFVGNRDSFYVQVDTPLMTGMFLNEMLLQSYDGVIRVFPAVPPCDSPICFHSLRAAGGFLVSSERRNNLTQYVVVKSLAGNKLRMRNPFVGEKDLAVQVKIYRLEDGMDFRKQGEFHAMLDRLQFPGDIIEFPTEKDRLYLVSKEIPWYSCIPAITLA